MTEAYLPVVQLYSKHAQARAQQRSIPPVIVDLLLSHGKVERCAGADRYTFDKRCKRKLLRYLGAESYLRIENDLACWAIVGDDGKVVSVGRRTKRSRR